MYINIYIILSGFIATVPLLVNKKVVSNVSLLTFSVLQLIFFFICWSYLNQLSTYTNEPQYFRIDAPALICLGVLSIITIASAIKSVVFISEENNYGLNVSRYATFFIGFVAAQSIAFLCNNVGLMWVFIELTTLFVGLLIYQNSDVKSLEAAWKYVFVSTICLALAFIGIVLFNIALEKNDGDALFFDKILANIKNANTMWVKIAFLFILCGYSVKMGLAPVHTVKIDANASALGPVNSLISGSLVNLGVLAIYRFYILLEPMGLSAWGSKILIIVGVLTIATSAAYMLTVRTYKRMLAYSSIEHVALMVIMMALGAYKIMFLHMIFHGLTKTILFNTSNSIFRVYKTFRIDKIKGMVHISPIMTMTFLLAILSVLGMPPFGLFITEFSLFKALWAGDMKIIAAFIFVLLTIIVYAMVLRILPMTFAKPDDKPEGKVNPLESIPELTLIILMVWLAFFPPEQLNQLLSALTR